MHNYITQGQVPVKKSNFFLLFQPAQVNTFTKLLVLTAFKATGIYLPNANVILNYFKTLTPLVYTTPLEQTGPQAALTKPNQLKAKLLLRSVVKDKASSKVRAVKQIIYQLYVQLELAQHKLSSVKQALAAKEKKKDKKTVLLLYAYNLKRYRGAIQQSPALKREADTHNAAFKAY